MRRTLLAMLVALVLLGACSTDGSDTSSASGKEPADDETSESTTTTAAPGLTPPVVETVEAESELSEATQDQLTAAVIAAMNEQGIPGAFVGVYLPDGSWEAVAGLADLEDETPVEFGLNWPVRSLTKSMVVTLLLVLVDEGVLSLDDTVDQYLDDVPNGDLVTVRHLASMSGGLPNYTSTDAFLESFIGDPFQDFTTEQLNDFAFTEEPEFLPGAAYTYSNTETNVLGQVLEEVQGEPLSDQLEEKVFEPLGMTGTDFLPDEFLEPHATGYQPTDDGYVEPPNNFSGMGPSGAVVSTSDDLRIWAEALATGTLVSEDLQAQRLVAQPLVEGPDYEAYGMGIGTRFGYWGHTGQGLGFTALAMHDAETGVSIVILTNTSDTEIQPMDALFEAVVPVLAEL